MTGPPADPRAILADLERRGLLLLSDARLPSVAGLVAGEPIRGSWWGHPRSHDIFRAATAVAEHPDVVAAKLVGGKVTFIHRRLWPALLAVASSREAWQTTGLPAPARLLLARIDARGRARTDRLPRPQAAGSKVLEQRLLVHEEEVHTETGAHAKSLERWDLWAARAGLAACAVPSAEGKRRLEQAARRLSEGSGAEATLPWKQRPLSGRGGGRPAPPRRRAGSRRIPPRA